MATHEHNQRQIERRRAGDRVRVEVVFDVTDYEQKLLMRWLTRNVEKSKVGAFIRAAIAEKIERDGEPVQPVPHAAPAAQHDALGPELVLSLMAEVNALRERVAASEALAGAPVRATVQPRTDAATDPGEQASGLDMSGPRRPRTARAPAIALPPVDPARPAFDPLRETQQLIAGIRKYGVAAAGGVGD